MTTYVGHKGYTIYKKSITLEQRNKINSDLFITPFTPVGKSKSFYFFRESNQKYYLPYYYGVNVFGPPNENKLSPGIDISVPFIGTLRDYQIEMSELLNNHWKQQDPNGLCTALLQLYTGWGKTTYAIYELCKNAKKGLIIVHSSNLKEQWIERIQLTAPSARIGVIQGQQIDVDDKDFVICMLQTLMNKDLPEEIISQFGFVIYDEVHHLAGETFSNLLFKCVVPKCLGLSATMERQDRTECVYEMALGKVLKKVTRETNLNVSVKGIRYENNDLKFNEVLLNWQGKTDFANMMAKISNYVPRTMFILDVLKHYLTKPNYLTENNSNEHLKQNCPNCNTPQFLYQSTCCKHSHYCHQCTKNEQLIFKSTKKRINPCPYCPNRIVKYEPNYIHQEWIKPLNQFQILVFSHELSTLNLMHEHIVTTNMASTAFIIGGITKEELIKAKTKQIILGTYTACREAIDIPTLNSIMCATPMTNMTQAVGRMFRDVREGTQFTIIDIIDKHNNYKNQWTKRKTFYKSQNYDITETSSKLFPNGWKNTNNKRHIEPIETWLTG